MINSKELFAAIDAIEQEKGISRDIVLNCLKEAIEKVFRKQLDGMDDALVRVDIDAKAGAIRLFQQKKVVENVEDDFLEISLEEVSALGLKLKVGDVYEIESSIADFKKSEAIKVTAIFKQKLAEAEKAALFELYKDKIGEMVVGSVEKTDDRSTILNIGRTSVFLTSSQKIPGETFKPGDRVKLYVQDVVSTSKGARIAVSRADPGFLKRLFEEEIHEIYDGTVVIKAIAREAGLRSKVAVVSNDANVDPAGACIGQNGSRIQKIVGQLGNVKDKEKIDVIVYHDHPGLFIMESLKPAQVVGVIIDNEEAHLATAVIANGQTSVAIGKKGSNSRLSKKLTGWEISIKEQDEIVKAGLLYQTADDLRREAEEEKRRKAQEAYIASIKPTPKDDIPAAQPTSQTAEEKPVAPSAIPSPAVTKEPVIAAKPVITPAAKPVVETPKTVVKTTKTLEDLEKELEKEVVKQPTKPLPKKKPFKRKPYEERKPGSDVPSQPSSLKPTSYMNIYTEEELAEAEKEKQETKEPEKEGETEIEDFDEYYDEEDKKH